MLNTPLRTAADSGLRDDLLVDTAISRLEKLRRVFALEEWIRDAADQPHLCASSEKWRAERERLLEELQLEGIAEQRPDA